MKARTVALALLVTLVAAAAVPAQEDDGPLPMTWLAFSKVKPGKMQDAVALTLKYDQASYDQLVKEGVVLSWGIATPINHFPGDPANHAVWVTVPDWKAVDRWAETFAQAMQARGPEGAAEAQAASEEVYEAGAHYDSVRHSLYFHAAEKASPPRYYYTSSYTVDFAEEPRFLSLYKKVALPIAQRLQAEGKISSFGMHAANLHGEAGWTHLAWYAVDSLATMGRIQDGIRGGLTPEVLEGYMSIADEDAHRDQIWMILHQAGIGAE